MAGFGQTTRKDILDYIFKGTSPSGKPIAAAGVFYIALFTAAPGNDGTGGTEVSTSGTAYAAKLTAATDWGVADSASPTTETNNSAILSFVQATGSGFGTVAYAGLYTHVTTRSAATFLGGNTLGASQLVSAGNTFSFPVNAFKIQLSG